MGTDINNILDLVNKTPLSITALVINLVIGFLLSLIIRWHFKKFGSTLSNREEFSQVFPFVLLTTTLIITVVKSSLALSLGLVGALSIVRFRTPIKEPEELAYLFISISIGLGLGANQTILTITAGLIILGFMATLRWHWVNKGISGKSLFLTIGSHSENEEIDKKTLEQLNEILKRNTRSCDLRRFDMRSNSFEAVYLVDFSDIEVLGELIDKIKNEHPNWGITFLDQNQLPGI